MSTRGIQVLKHNHVPFEVVRYEHQEKGAVFAARAAGYALAQTIKTLVVTLDNQRHVLVLMPGDRQASMKKTARACQAKTAELADTQTAQRLTGYLIGGISPFGTRQPLPVIMEKTLQTCPEVLINAGQRGTMVKIKPADLIAVIKPMLTDLLF